MKYRSLLISIVLVVSLGLLTAGLWVAAAASSASPRLINDGAGSKPLDGELPHLEGSLPSGGETEAPEGVPGDWDGVRVHSPRVVISGGQYLMLYDGWSLSGYAVGLATSNEGITWTKEASNPVLKPGDPGQWDSYFRGQVAFLEDGGLFKMWYSGSQGGPWQTGYATSTNAIDWNIYPGGPVLSVGGSGDWDEVEADGPSVILDGGVYKMWYHGCDPLYAACSIGYAESPDGINWTKYAGNPVLTATLGGWDEPNLLWPSVVKNGSTYLLWYSSNDQIGLATSSDEITWTKHPNPVMTDGWDGIGAVSANILLDGATFKSWFVSGAGARRGIGYAKSAEGITWTMPYSNPLLLPGSGGLEMRVNYAHDWVIANTGRQVPVTVTVADVNGLKASLTGVSDGNGEMRTWEWGWNPNQPNLLPGDKVTVTASGLSAAVNPVGTIQGSLDVDADLVAGNIQAPWFDPITLTVRCEVWAENGPPPIEVQGVDPNGGSYQCDFGSQGWDIQPGQQVAVIYFEPDGDQVINVLESPWMRINYAHEWVGGNYPAGHTISIEVRDGGGSLKGSAQIVSTVNGGWGTEGFETKPEDWTGMQPDIQPGDSVSIQSDDGYSNTIQVGTVGGTVDSGLDLVSGPVYAPWFSDTLDMECHPWGAPGGAPVKNSTAGPNGSPQYTCQWDPLAEWDVLPGQEIAAMYIEPDRDRVINVLREPAPHLRIYTNGEGQPGEGGNYTLRVDYFNDGDTPADGVVITGVLVSGMTYLDDTSAFTPSGTGTPGDPLVWQVGDLSPSNNRHFFYIFVHVDALQGEMVENYVQIETSTPYGQGDPWLKESTWSTQIVSNDTDVTVEKNSWTWDPLPGGDFVYNLNVCNKGSTGSSEVILTDTLPLSTTLVGWWGQHTGWWGVQSSDHLVVVSRPSVPSQWCGEVYVMVTLDQNAWNGMTISNTATISASNDLNPDNNQSTIWHQVGWPHNNLSIYADWNYGTLVPGGSLHYELSYHNNGNQPVNNVSITSTLPVSTSFSGAWYYDEYGPHPVTPTLVMPGEYVVWDLGILANGFGGRFDIMLDVDPQAAPGTVLTHTAQITRLPAEDDYDDNEIVWVETLNDAGPNLRVDKRVRWNWDGQLNYEIRLLNMGTQTLNNLWITDTYALSTTYNGQWWVNHGGWFTITEDTLNRQLIWWGERLQPGETASLGFNLDLDGGIVGQPGLTFTNQVGAPVTGDVYPADNQSSVKAFTGPDLYVEKSLTGGELLPGQVVTYTIRFGNNQLGEAWWWGLQGTAWMTDTLPDELTFLSAELLYCGEDLWCPFDPFAFTDSQVVFQFWPIGASGHNEIRLRAQVADTVTGLDLLTNTVEMYSDRPDVDVELNTVNNLSFVSTPVMLPYFTTVKSYQSSSVAGMPVTYTLQVENQGYAPGSSVWLADWLPQFVTYTAGGSFANGQVSWTIPQLEAQTGQAGASFSGLLSCSAGEVVNNWQYGVTGSDQGVTSTFGAPVSFTIQPPAMSLNAQASALAVTTGQAVSFTATGTTDGTPLSYEWQVGSTVIGQGSAISYAFATPGSYTVAMTATDGCGFSSTVTLVIEVTQAQSTILLPVILH